MKSTKSKIMIVMCVALLVMAVGYAAFSTVLTITGTANITSEWKVVFTNITQVSKTDGVTIKSTPSASGTTATFDVGLTSPGDKIVYKITLANQGTIDALITNIEASATDSPAIIFTIDGVNIGDELDSKTSKEFNVTIEYDPYVTSQPDKLQKTLTVSIVTAQKINQSIDSSTPSVDQPTYLSSAILRDNIAYADTNIDFKYSSEGCYDENGEDICDDSKATNGLYYTNTNTENNLTTYYFRGAVENNYVKMGKRDGCGYKGFTVPYADMSTGDISFAPTEEQCLSTNVCYISEGISGYYYATGLSSDACAYYGGTVLTEKATYGNDAIDILWRIVRINEDGSIRIITQDSVGMSAYNTNGGDNAYVGYMCGTPGSVTYKETHNNTNDSTIKAYLDDWYENKSNLSSYVNRISNAAGFCNDRSVASTANTWDANDTALGYGKNKTYYGASNRLVNVNDNTAKENAQPQFACPNAGNDLFTTSSSTKGNKALKNPIGLLTTDEAVYAGATWAHSNTSMYLPNAGSYWTMSPLIHIGSSLSAATKVGLVLGGGSLSVFASTDRGVDLELGVLPVINLKSTVEIIGGDGTPGNPYIIK